MLESFQTVIYLPSHIPFTYKLMLSESQIIIFVRKEQSMTKVIVNDKTKAGRTLIEFLKNSEYATVGEYSPTIDSLLKGLTELQQAKSGTLEGKSARQLAEEL